MYFLLYLNFSLRQIFLQLIKWVCVTLFDISKCEYLFRQRGSLFMAWLCACGWKSYCMSFTIAHVSFAFYDLSALVNFSESFDLVRRLIPLLHIHHTASQSLPTFDTGLYCSLDSEKWWIWALNSCIYNKVLYLQFTWLTALSEKV